MCEERKVNVLSWSPSKHMAIDTDENIRVYGGEQRRSERSLLYAQLKRELRAKGFFEKEPAYYKKKIPLTIGLWAISFAVLLLVDNFAVQLLNAVYLGFVSTQLGLLGHDAGHQQIFRKHWKNRLLGLLVGNLLLGISNAYWVDKHNLHHSQPNQLDVDPDIDIPLLVFAAEDIHKRWFGVRWLLRYQAFFFFPLLTMTFIDLIRQSWLFLLQRRQRDTAIEAFCILAHFCCYGTVLLSRFGLWQSVLFLLVHYTVTGLYMGSIFAPNHKGMPLVDKDEQKDFLSRQVETARNVKGHPVIDFWYGGLNYQIEHHLFPVIARNKLRAAQGIIRPFCEEHGIGYTETSFLASYRAILEHLHEVSKSLR